MMDGFERIAQTLSPKPAEEQKSQGNTLDDTPLEQVKALLPSVDEELKPQLEAYIQKRENQEYVKGMFKSWESEQAEKQAQQQAAAEAAAMYPELADKTSDFAKAVQNHLDLMGDAYRKGNPRALLDAANAVAVREGKVAATKTSRGPATKPANRQNAAPADSGGASEAEGPFSDEDMQKIADRYKHVKRGGFKDLKQMRRDANEIFANKEYFIS